MGYLGLDKLLHDKTTLRIMSKISFNVYERLDARVMQIIMVCNQTFIPANHLPNNIKFVRC